MRQGLNPVLERIYQTGGVEDAEGNSISAFPSSLTYERGLPLYELVRRSKAEKTLEVGMAYGISTLFICQAHQDKGSGSHTAIDPGERALWKSIGLLNIQRAGLERFMRFYEAPSHEALPRLLVSGESFDVIFIDGSHLFDYVLLDLYYADMLLKNGGYIMLDDLWMPSVRKASSFMLRNKAYRLAPEYLCESPALWQRCFRFARCVGQDPWSFHSIYYAALFALRGFLNFCVLQKVAENDQRKWDHYSSF